MTDPVIAPSFPSELEQLARELSDDITQCEADYQDAVSEGKRTGTVVAERAPCEDCDKAIRTRALLTRAAALARAAEAMLKQWPQKVWIKDLEGNGVRFTVSVVIAGKFYDGPVITDEMEALRALVLSEGSGE